MSLTLLNHSYINNKYELFGFTEELSNNAFLPIRLENVDIAVANALRRIFMSEVPTFAFAEENVKLFPVNVPSQYHRQVLIERIGLITLDCNLLNIDDMIFSITDPVDPSKPLKNTTNGILKIRLHEYLYIQESASKVQVPTKSVIPYNSLLLTLNPNEEVHVVMKATSGVGRQHTRWQSSITMYKFETEFDSNPKIGHVETNEEQALYKGHELKQPSAVILTIESVGKLYSKTVVMRGIDILKEKLQIFRDLLIGQTSEAVSIEIDENIPNLVKLKIINEDHTLGHLLESSCLNRLKSLIKTTIGSDETEGLELLLESLVAYRKPHPLDNYIEFSVRTPQKLSLTFPNGQFDEIENPSIRLILLAVDDMQILCDKLTLDAKMIV